MGFWVLVGSFFREILTFLEQLADKSELLGEICVITEKTSVIIHLYFSLHVAVLFVSGFLPCLILERRLIFFPSSTVLHCCFGTGAPDIFGCSVNSMNCSGNKFGEEIYSSWLTSTVGSFLCFTFCFVDNCLTPLWWTQGQHRAQLKKQTI